MIDRNTVSITASQHVTTSRLSALHNAIVSVVSANVDIVRVRTRYPVLDVFNVTPEDYETVSDIMHNARRTM
jgi:hypothetical protein